MSREPSLSYQERQRLRDREYLQAWKSMPARERRRLQKAGIAPELPTYRTAKPDTTPTLDRASSQEPVPDDPHPAFAYNEEALLAGYRRIVCELLDSDRPALTLACLALVTNIAYDGSTQSEIAKQHGITRAAVSKRCVQLTELLGLPPSRAMRALTVRSAYADRARKTHLLNQRSA